MSSRKKIIGDMFLNIIAAAIPIALLQLLIYPYTAKVIGGEEYGLMITVYSMWSMISNSLGNVLNATRLLYYNEYDNKNSNGDFNIIFKKWNIINAIIICGIIIFYCKGFNWEHIILGVVCSALIFTKAYTEVCFRLILNYKAIVFNNALQGFGFLVGMFLLFLTGIWEFIFLFGYLFSCIFCIIKSGFYRESKEKTDFFKKVDKDINRLVMSTIVGAMMDYADKLVLYPLMGGSVVSIYYTATVLGRIVGMLTGPINSVILSYIVRLKNNPKHIFNKILLSGITLCVLGYIITLLISRPVLGVLFPQWVDDVLLYIPVTTINVLLLVVISIVSPFALKFYNLRWQIVINGASVIVYFCASIFLWYQFGLMGFCVGTILGTATKLLVMLGVYYFSKENSIKTETQS